jgi:hypothetical protein
MPPSKPEQALISGSPTLLIIGSEANGDRVHAVALIGCTKTDFRSVDRCQRQETMRGVLTWVFVTLPFEHMAEMTSASSAGDLGAFNPESAVYVARHSAWDGWQEDTVNMARPHIAKRIIITVEKRWPAAAAVELGGALVKRGVATHAGVDPDRFMMLVLPRATRLGALRTKHPELCARSL